MTTAPNLVIVTFDERGNIDFHACGSDVRLLVIDERAPHDRIYEYLTRNTPREMAELIRGDETIGSKEDARHPALRAAILALMNGVPHLHAVDGGKE